MNFLQTPNLPEKNVKYLVCDSRVEDTIKKELNNLDVELVLVDCLSETSSSISYHPDIHLFHEGKGNFVTSFEYHDDFSNKVRDLLCENFNNRRVDKKLTSAYPGDVLLNAVNLDKYIICNVKTIDKGIRENPHKELISVKQGYTKCSTAIVSNEAIITDDISIYNSCKNKIDVLLIDKGLIKLNGYNYGFIGGCTGKLSKNILAFCGDINKLICRDEIISFCRNHSVNCISLSNKDPYDYGSLIPIIEE